MAFVAIGLESNFRQLAKHLVEANRSCSTVSAKR